MPGEVRNIGDVKIEISVREYNEDEDTARLIGKYKEFIMTVKELRILKEEIENALGAYERVLKRK